MMRATGEYDGKDTADLAFTVDFKERPTYERLVVNPHRFGGRGLG
jgi:hypothetical protein